MGRRMLAALLLFGLACVVSAEAMGNSLAPSRRTALKSIVLGSRTSFGAYGRGWGVPHPTLLDNNGDPSGLAWHIRWAAWGTAFARGSGLTYVLGQSIGSGYREGRVELRASHIGRCLINGPLAYTRLEVRVAPLKHGSFTRWHLWNDRPNVCHATQ